MANEEGEAATEVVDQSKRSVSVKCRPNRLAKLIGKLNNAQREAVQRIGFGGLLHLKLRSFPLSHVRLFMEAFGDESHVFRASKSKEFMVTKHDVYDCFMLPLGSRQIEIVPTGNMPGSQDAENVRIKNYWREKYEVKTTSQNILLGKVFDHIESEELEDGGDEFCRVFVLLCMSSFLAPTLTNSLEMKLFRAVEDVSVIPQLDWCSYVLEATARAVADVSQGRGKSHVLGCIPFLMIMYFQRYDYPGKTCPHDLPLIKHWDHKTLSDRIKGELGSRPLGRLTLSKVKYPRCLQLSKSAAAAEKKFIQIELPPGTEDDEQLKDRSLDVVHELYLKIQRNAIVFHSWYADAISKIKCLTGGASSSSGVVPSQATQEFLKDSKLSQYVEEAEEIATRLKQSVDNAPKLQEEQKSTENKVQDEQPSAGKVCKLAGEVVGKGVEDARVEAVSLGDDDDMVTTSQIMSTVDFYNTADLNDACLREQEEEGGDVEESSQSGFSQLAEIQALESCHSLDDMVSTNERLRMNAEANNGSVEAEVAAKQGSIEAAVHVGQKDTLKGVDNVREDVVLEQGSLPSQLKFISTADIDNALRGLSEIGEVGHKANDDVAMDGGDVDCEGTAESVKAVDERDKDKDADEEIVQGGDNATKSLELVFALTFCSTADLKEALRGVPDPVFGTVEEQVPCENKSCVGNSGFVDRPVDGFVKEVEKEAVHEAEAGFVDKHVDGFVKEVERGAVHEGEASGIKIKSLEFESTFMSTTELKEAFHGVPEVGSIRGEEPEAGADVGAQVIYVPHTDVNHHPFLLHSTERLSCMDVAPENLGCSIDCGEPKPDYSFVTDYLQCNKKLYDTVFIKRKEVMDYVFSQSTTVKKFEQLVLYNDFFFITREDMRTLLPGQQIMDSVIDGWCLLLNHMMNENTAPVPTSRCFIGLCHTNAALDIDQTEEIFAMWDVWAETCVSPLKLDSDMIFIPVLSGNRDHYSCACVNFLTEQIEYLDNHSYDEDIEKLPYGGIARIVADIMGKYLVAKGIEKGSKVNRFKLVNIQFKWQGTGYTSYDCGVYFMVHMLLYCGKLFECGLGEKDAINLYRAEIAATLVLSDINKLRGDVLLSISSFKEVSAHHMTRKLNAAVKRKSQAGQGLTYSKRPRCSTPNVESVEVVTPLVPVKSRGQGSSNARSLGSGELSVVKSRPRGGGDGLGCSLDCEGPGALAPVVSKLLRNNQSLLKDVKPLRKHVADYCFLDDYIFETTEKLVWYSRNAKLCRRHIMSMLPDTSMSPEVIECWSVLLNQIESDENIFQRMAFFGARHMEFVRRLVDESFDESTQFNAIKDKMFLVWDTFVTDCKQTFNLNANYLFIPFVVADHYACVCINFKDATFDLLDYHHYPNWEKSAVCKAAIAIASAMSDYLDSRGVARGFDVTNFKPRQVELQQVSPAPCPTESGIFTMMHMLMYEGSPFQHPDLDKKVSRRYLVVELAAILVLADINVFRDDILVNIDTFIAGKEKIKEDLQRKRRIRQICLK